MPDLLCVWGGTADEAADILQQFGGQSLAGSKIFFVSDRSGSKEIWSMDYDGSNQTQMTNYKSTSKQPAVSMDGKMFAFQTLVAFGSGLQVVHITNPGTNFVISEQQLAAAQHRL